MVALVVDKSEIQEAAQKQGDLEFISHLAESMDFRQDLSMSQSYWFYSPETQKRTLLLQYTPKPDAKPEELKSSIRALGAKAAGEL